MLEENQSIYQRIKSALQSDGTLPEEFVLRQLPQEGMKFADGAMDGTIRYHMGPTKNPDISALTLVLEMASKERYKDAANALITHFNQGGMMLPVIDALQEWIYSHTGVLSPEHLGQFVRTLLLQSNDVESVKFALVVLEVLEQEPDGELREMLLTLASSEELTLFCLFNFGIFADANEMTFALAKKLKGWGRIHAVSSLRNTSEEIGQWLLTEGWQNEIMPEYSAITVIKRTKLYAPLQGKVSDELFAIAGKLIGYSLGDSPVKGLSSSKNAGQLLTAYLGLAAKRNLGAEEYGNIFDIKAFAESGELEEKQQIVSACQAILDSDRCISCINEAMAKGQGLYLGKAMGLDFAPQAMAALRRDWQESYDLIDLLLPDKLYVDEIIELFSEKLPLEEMASGPENEMGNSPEYKDYGVLSYVIQGLQAVPGKGEDLICAGLWSPVIGCRNIALNTIDKWRKADYQLTDKMRELIADLKEAEVHEQTRKRLENF